MVLVAKPKRTQSIHHKKRQGAHQKQTKRFMKTYWPYLPMLAIVGLGLLFNDFLSMRHTGVLGYATDISASSLLADTNAQRTQYDEAGLQLNTQLTAAAQAKANNMAALNYWSHDTPSGQPPWVFITQAGYQYQSAGENLAYGFSSSSATLSAWMNSPEHRANILDGKYQDVGFGIANAPDYQGSGPETIVVAEYGQPASSVQTAAAPIPQSGSTGSAAARRFNSSQPAQRISRLQILAGWHAEWLVVAVSVAAGGAAALFIAKHWRLWRRSLLKGEAFMIHHAWLDIALVAVITIGVVLSHSAGIIQ